MFTEQPPLTQRIERLIDETPKIDPHTHISCAQPSAPDLASLLSYHWVRTELHAAGMPQADLDPALPASERVGRMVPYLGRIRNTAIAWCLARIFRDLYDFEEPWVNESNVRTLSERVEIAGKVEGRGWDILTRRCTIRKFVTSLGNRGSDDQPIPEMARFMLDAHYLFCPGVATDLTPFFAGRTTRPEYSAALRDILGELPTSLDRLDQALRDWLDRTVTGPVRFTNTYIPIEQRFRAPERIPTDLALAAASRNETLEDSDLDHIVRAVTWSVLGWHSDHRKAFQIAVGAEYFICDGKSIPRFDPHWFSEMVRAFHHFSGARFDLMMASDVHAHELAVVIRQFPNIYASGYWWHSFIPSMVERAATLRLQAAPACKFGGFLSDAYSVEWAYAKLQLVKRALASALAGLIESRWLEEDLLPDVLFQILHETPRVLYDIE